MMQRYLIKNFQFPRLRQSSYPTGEIGLPFHLRPHSPAPLPGTWNITPPDTEGGNIDLSSDWNKFVRWSKAKSKSDSTSWSRSTSYNESFGGLENDVRSRVKGLLQNLVSNMPALTSSVINAQPNQNVLNNLLNLTDLARANWIRNVRPIYNKQMKDTITSLANRGILDSSVASNFLGQLSGQYLTNYGNMLSDLEKYRIGTALNYPMKSTKLLSNLISIVGVLSRISRSRGSSQSDSGSKSKKEAFSQSYDPTPAVGLLTALLGI